MKLYINGLERRKGYFEMPFHSYQLLGSERDKLIVIGDDLGGNFEICLSPKNQGDISKFVIFQTPDNFMYNTLGYIVKFTTTNNKNLLQVFFDKDDLNKIEVLGVDIEYSGHSSDFQKTYILKISLANESDKVNIIEKNGEKKPTLYTFQSRGLNMSLIGKMDTRNYELIDNINLLKIDVEFEKISCII